MLYLHIYLDLYLYIIIYIKFIFTNIYIYTFTCHLRTYLPIYIWSNWAPLISGKSRLVNYYNLVRSLFGKLGFLCLVGDFWFCTASWWFIYIYIYIHLHVIYVHIYLYTYISSLENSSMIFCSPRFHLRGSRLDASISPKLWCESRGGWLKPTTTEAVGVCLVYFTYMNGYSIFTFLFGAWNRSW